MMGATNQERENKFIKYHERGKKKNLLWVGAVRRLCRWLDDGAAVVQEVKVLT